LLHRSNSRGFHFSLPESSFCALQRLGFGPQATNGGIAQHVAENSPKAAVITNDTTNKLARKAVICVNLLVLAPVSGVSHFRHFLGRIGTARPLLKPNYGRDDRISVNNWNRLIKYGINHYTAPAQLWNSARFRP
jgi:hypothetical protein